MNKHEIGNVLIRVVLGIIFMVHGFDKFLSGIANVVERFEEYGIPFATLVAFVIAFIELIGGTFLILGFSTRFVAGVFIVIMLGAIITVHFEQGFLQGYEFNIVLIAMASYLVITGTKLFSLDSRFEN